MLELFVQRLCVSTICIILYTSAPFFIYCVIFYPSCTNIGLFLCRDMNDGTFVSNSSQRIVWCKLFIQDTMGGCCCCSSRTSESDRAPVHIYVCRTCFGLHMPCFSCQISSSILSKYFLLPLPLTPMIIWFILSHTCFNSS